MSLELSAEQQAAVDARPGQAVPVLDPRSNAAYWLVPVPADVVDDDRIEDWYPAIFESLGRAGWDDPAMDVYNNYEENYRKLYGEPG
jgi:hypothetical protein